MLKHRHLAKPRLRSPAYVVYGWILVIFIFLMAKVIVNNDDTLQQINIDFSNCVHSLKKYHLGLTLKVRGKIN